MEGIFVLSFLAIIVLWVLTLIGLVSPKQYQNFRKGKIVTRGQVLLFGVTGTIVLFIIIAITAPDINKNTATVTQVQTENSKAVKAVNVPEKKQEVVATTSSKPVTLETNIGMTPEQFRQGFNKRLNDLDLDSVRPLAEFNIKNGEVKDIFQVPFSDEINMTGTVNKDGMLQDITFIIVPKDNPQKTMLNSLILIGNASNTINNGEYKSEAGKAITDLITKALDGIDNENNSHNKIVGNTEYYAMASKYTGLWVGISPAKE